MKNFIALLVLILCFSGCTKSENNSGEKDELPLKINAGFMCGWGAGEDSLYISNTIVKYVYYVPAKSNLPKIKKSRSTTDAEWENIVNSLNLNYFMKLNYNTCNICVDGCDEWISVQNEQISHQIRFGMGLKIDSLDRLQNILVQIRAEFQQIK